MKQATIRSLIYKGNRYKSLRDLYYKLKSEETVGTFQSFLRKYQKTKSITKSLKASPKRARSIYYRELYEKNKTENSIRFSEFAKRMRTGAKIKDAIKRKK